MLRRGGLTVAALTAHRSTKNGGENGGMAKAPRHYDIAESARTGRELLQKMRAEKRPGEGARGTKTDVLAAMKSEIAALLREGYTATQIADALAEGGLFSAQPKTIAEVAGVSRKSSRRPRTGSSASQARQESQAHDADDQTHGRVDDSTHGTTKSQPVSAHEKGRKPSSPPPTDKSTFAIKPDTHDL
jgi:hypothetical protein